MPVPTNEYIAVRKQRDALGRAIKKLLKPPLFSDGFCDILVPEDRIDILRRAHDKIYVKPELSPLQKRILKGFARKKKARK